MSTTAFNFKCSEDELEKIKGKAKKAGFSTASAYAKFILLSDVKFEVKASVKEADLNGAKNG